MFKIEGLNLPTEVKKDAASGKESKNGGKNGGKNGANNAGQKRPNLTQMFSELEQKENAPKSKRRRGKHASKASIESADLIVPKESNAEQSEQKPEQKKPEQKPEQKKPEQKKPEQKKPEQKKPEQSEQKPEQKQQKQQKQQPKKQQQKQQKQQNQNQQQKDEKKVEQPVQKAEPEESLVMNKKKVTLTPLQQKMQQKLSGARFRWINELLYTSESQKAVEVFETQPEVFDEYHEGFRNQVELWPENPVDSFVQQFQDRLKKHLNAPGGLPATKHLNQVVVADMGCGEAQLALKLSQLKHSKARFEVHSFDLHKANDRITVADIAHVPLPDNSCHVVVFCLALMGTNLNDFIKEGIRILQDNGIVWIAEIKSRFEGNKYDDFIEKLKSIGLYHKTTDDTNKMFVKFEFLKLPHRMARAKASDADIHLKPCIYKRR